SSLRTRTTVRASRISANTSREVRVVRRSLRSQVATWRALNGLLPTYISSFICRVSWFGFVGSGLISRQVVQFFIYFARSRICSRPSRHSGEFPCCGQRQGASIAQVQGIIFVPFGINFIFRGVGFFIMVGWLVFG